MILVTGGAGFVGANLCRSLLAGGRTLRILDDFSAGAAEYLEGLPVEVVDGDVRDPSTVRRATRDVDAVVHLAAQTGVPGSIADPMRDCAVNVIGTLNLLEACRLGCVSRLVLASSNATLGRQAQPAREDLAPRPVSPYGAGKLAAEGYCLAYHGTWGLETVILRFSNVYGPFSYHKQSVVAEFLKRALRRQPLRIDGDGSQVRDFLYVEDLGRAIALALSRDVAGEVFQVASGEGTSILELGRRVAGVAGGEVRCEHHPARPGDVPISLSQVTKAKSELGWEPSVGLDQGLRLTWEWFEAWHRRQAQGAAAG